MVGGVLWNPLSFLLKDSIQSNSQTSKESSFGRYQLVKNRRNLKCILPDYLVSISKAANNIEIYSKLNGCVHFDFCFYGCEVKVKN